MKHGRRWLMALLMGLTPAALALLAPGGSLGRNALAQGNTIYVDADAAGSSDGTSWDDAYTALQPALDAAVDGDEIWVAAGAYTPTYEFSPGDPRSATFQMKNGVALFGGFDPSVGDVGWQDRDWMSNVTTLSGDLGTHGDPADNSYHVFYHPAELALDATAVLDGFTVSDGNASSGNGGGMYNDASSPTVTNCTFSNNSAGLGGGMVNMWSSSPTVTDCTFSGNSATNGGGMENYDNSSPSVTNCTFLGNSADIGGGMFNRGSSPAVTGCTLSANTASSGAGMFNHGSSPILTNCTLSGNSADAIGGGMLNVGSSPSVTNSTLWGDSPDEIYDADSSTVVTYSDVQGGWGGTGNIDADPLFVGPASGDYHLGPGSPCIDAGTNDAPGLPEFDFEGEPRVVDGDVDGTAVVDMGVDEVQAYSLYLPAVFRRY